MEGEGDSDDGPDFPVKGGDALNLEGEDDFNDSEDADDVEDDDDDNRPGMVEPKKGSG